MEAIISTNCCSENIKAKKLSCATCDTPDFKIDPTSIVDIAQHLRDNPGQPHVPYTIGGRGDKRL